MTTDNIIDLLIITCSGLLVWSIAATLTVWSERKELKKLHQLRKEQQKQDNQIHKALTKEQKEVLTAWYKNLLSTYRIDFFRGVVLVRVVTYLCDGGSHRLMRAIGMCQEAERLGFEASSEDYIDLLASLNQITKEVPLSDEAESAIYHVIGGDWERAIEALEKLRSERNA